MLEKAAETNSKTKTNLKIGDKVRVTDNITWTGHKFKVWYPDYTVMEINGDRVVIGVNGIITAAVSSKNLQKV